MRSSQADRGLLPNSNVSAKVLNDTMGKVDIDKSIWDLTHINSIYAKEITSDFIQTDQLVPSRTSAAKSRADEKASSICCQKQSFMLTTDIKENSRACNYTKVRKSVRLGDLIWRQAFNGLDKRFCFSNTVNSWYWKIPWSQIRHLTSRGSAQSRGNRKIIVGAMAINVEERPGRRHKAAYKSNCPYLNCCFKYKQSAATYCCRPRPSDRSRCRSLWLKST